jgi:hypothetical protein
MSVAGSKIIEAIVNVLETETIAIKAGQLSMLAETAERKSRLMFQLLKAEPLSASAAQSAAQLHELQNALKSNLRVCKENIESIKEIIDLHLSVERQLDNDGTYALPVKMTHPT